MHRATPANSSFRGYSAGGTRSAMDQVNDTTQMQEMAGNFMSGEARKAVEAMQNYGFTSVTMDAIKSQLGKFMASAETAISFMGGNRSFPVAGNTDDRRHRLNGLDKGDSGMFGTQGMKQQFQMSNSDGMFGTVPNDKTMRMAMLDENSEQDMSSQSFQQQSSGGGGAAAAAVNGRDFVETDAKGVTRFVHVDRQGMLHRFRRVFPFNITNYSHVSPMPFDSGGGSGGGGGAGGAGGQDGMKMGQQSLKSKNQQAKLFFDVTKDATRASGKVVQLIMGSSSGGGSSGGSSQMSAQPGALNLPVDYVFEATPRAGEAAPRAGSGGGGSSGGSGGGSQNQGTVLAEASSDSKFYCGGTPKQGKYAMIVTVKGPTINVPGRIG